MTTTETNMQTAYEHIVKLLEQEETLQSPLAIAEREARREQISKEITALGKLVTGLTNRFHQLPLLPPLDIVQWAQAVLDMPNLAFVVLETTGVNDDADILRLYVADRDGEMVYDQIIQPERNFSPNTAYTGLTLEQISQASPLDEYWTHIKAVLAGRYVLAFNLPFVRDRLAENAKHYGLPPITLIGEDLQEKCRRFWDGYYPPKLATLCEKIAYPLPTPAPAPERARAQLALLQAMSQGITSVKQDDLSDIDEGPF